MAVDKCFEIHYMALRGRVRLARTEL